jgi:rhodanese-related sulfurtransferase
VARLLIDRGFTRVRPLEGGFDGWISAGLPVEGESLYAIRPASPSVENG